MPPSDDAIARIGASLRARRKDLDLTQAQVAEQANVSVRFVRNVETGKGGVQLDLVLGIVEVLGLRMVLARPQDTVPTQMRVRR